jgi:hypothetical protein
MKSEQKVRVFTLVSAYLPLKDALNLLSLNKYFRDHLPSSLFKQYIVENALALIFSDHLELKTIEQMLTNMDFSTKRYDIIYYSIISSQNLVKNPYGIKHISILSNNNKPEGWTLHIFNPYKPFLRRYTCGTSRPGKELKQRIQLPKFPHRFLWANTSTSLRSGYGADAKLVIKFDNGEKFTSREIEWPCDESNVYARFNMMNIRRDEMVSLNVRCRVPEHARKVELKLMGRKEYYNNQESDLKFGTTSLRIFKIYNEIDVIQKSDNKVSYKQGSKCTII